MDQAFLKDCRGAGDNVPAKKPESIQGSVAERSCSHSWWTPAPESARRSCRRQPAGSNRKPQNCFPFSKSKFHKRKRAAIPQPSACRKRSLAALAPSDGELSAKQTGGEKTIKFELSLNCANNIAFLSLRPALRAGQQRCYVVLPSSEGGKISICLCYLTTLRVFLQSEGCHTAALLLRKNPMYPDRPDLWLGPLGQADSGRGFL